MLDCPPDHHLSFISTHNMKHICLGALGTRWMGWNEACLQTDALTSEEHGRRLEDVTIAFGGVWFSFCVWRLPHFS